MSSDPSTQGTGRTIRIGKYEVLAHIASGGMGAVYRAYDTENAREVALKVMTPELAAKPAMLERFRREARSGLKLQHENVVALYEFGEANGTCFLAMEFVEGIDLHEYIDKKGTLDPEETRQIVIQAARALNHAHKHGIVHRDIKPSNFLLTQQSGHLRVKLTDLGLARETNTAEYRVTRSGTTVGTVDYISPEQARDSGLADIRSDLYSLGCTWYHMLAGETPFPEGGLAERLLKHMTADPPDIRRIIPRASDELVRVLGKLLAKKPEDRYQNPQELIEDLVSLNPLAKLSSRGKSKASRRALATGKKRSGRGNLLQQGKGFWILTGLAAVALVAGPVFWLGSRGKGTHASEEDIQPADPPARPIIDYAGAGPNPLPKPVSPIRTVHPPKVSPPAKIQYPPLYKPAVPINVAHTRLEFEKPWANQLPVPSDAKVLRVTRAPGQTGSQTFSNLAAAFAAAQPGKTTIIEINDNGPLFETPASAPDRSLVVRAGKGFRPLLVCDLQKKPGTRPDDGRSLAFLEVQRGSLTLEGLDVVLQWPGLLRGRGALVQVTDGDLTATGCTFSVAGKAPDGVTVARLTGGKSDGGRCRLTHCYGRGKPLVALEMELPGGEALLDDCLFVGWEAALIQARAVNAKPITVRTIRSTLVCGQSLLSIQPAATEDRAPSFSWMSWDSLFACSNRQGGSDMVVVAGNVRTQNLRWQATNCLYTGWQTLMALEDDTVYSSRNVSQWRVHWNRTEGDDAKAEPWPAGVHANLAEISPTFFRPVDMPVAYAATADPNQPLGCALDLLPPVRDSWLGLTYERFMAPPLEVLGDRGAPEWPRALTMAEPYPGEVLDLNSIDDLGKHLRQRLKQFRQFAPRVVLHLGGSGQKKTTPFAVPRGTSLVLYFVAPRDNSPTLSLVATAGAGQALFETLDGSLDIIGADLRLPEQPGGQVLPYLLKVQGGDLRLQRCRLARPLIEESTGFESLIHLQGSGSSSADKARGLLVERCRLVSGRDAIHVQGIGARVVVGQSLLVAGGNTFHFDLGEAYQGRANVQCTLTNTTVAARNAVIHLCDVRDAPVPLEPMIVQTRNCAFMNPFPGANAGILAYDGSALEHGLLVWQGTSDGFHSKLYFRAVQTGTLPDKAQRHALWSSLWGSVGDRLSQSDPGAVKPFDNNVRWEAQLDRLVFQGTRQRFGADLEKLGLKKKLP